MGQSEGGARGGNKAAYVVKLHISMAFVKKKYQILYKIYKILATLKVLSSSGPDVQRSRQTSQQTFEKNHLKPLKPLWS